jgi:sugar-specific transcriptional regulator TrmB
MVTFVVLSNRKEVIEKASELISKARIEVLGMGRQIAWIETEKLFGDACTQARKRNVSMKMLAIKDEGAVKHFAKEFEKIGASVRYYNHGDIRVVIRDREEALMAIPSRTTWISPGPREYAGMLINDGILIDQLVKRFDEMWMKGMKEGEARELDRLKYFLLEHKGEIIVGIALYFIGIFFDRILDLLRVLLS